MDAVKLIFARVFAFYLRKFPLRGGKKPLSKIVGPWCEGQIAINAYGVPMLTRFHDNTNRRAFSIFPDPVIEYARALPAEGAFVDIGANQGAVSLIASRALGSAGIVFAFEPCQKTVEYLRKNIELNCLKNVHIYEGGVGATTTSVHIGTPDETHSGAAFIGGGDEHTTIQALDENLDIKALIGERRLFVKIDTEGYELQVLKGMRLLLAEKRIESLIIELNASHLERFGGAIGDVYKVLSDFGYKPRIGPKEGHYDEIFTAG